MIFLRILYPNDFKDIVYLSSNGFFYPKYQLSKNNILQYLDDNEMIVSKTNVEKSDEHNWKYNINEFGFRGDWNLNSNNKKIGFFGCSVTAGVGVREEYTFPHLVSAHCNNFEYFNFGTTGASIQRISKIVSLVNKHIDLDYIILTLPATARMSYKHPIGILTDSIPGEVTNKNQKIYDIFDQEEFDLYAVDYIRLMSLELKNKHVLWSSWCPHTYKMLENLIDKKCLLSQFPYNDNQARDNSHPGPGCHKTYSLNIIQQFQNKGWL